MEQQQYNITRKRERHFNNTKTVIAIGFILFGICFAIPLTVLWPQYFSAIVFNSKLSFHLIIDIEDYFTCDNNYRSFVVDEPSQESSLLSIYIYNITNPADIIERGDKPNVVQTGPYGFRKLTYKYNVSFDPINSLTISFQEYNILQAIPVETNYDLDVCRRMYYRMGRAYLTLNTDPCADGSCNCVSSSDDSSLLTVVNPLFLKLIKEESAFLILSYFAIEVFQTIKSLIENDFVEAARAHLVSVAIQEIYIFRRQMQISKLLTTSYHTLLKNYTSSEIVYIMNNYDITRKYPSTCGLAIYGISDCVFFDLSEYISGQKSKVNSQISNTSTILYPSVEPIFNISNELSIFNVTDGLPKWLALCYYQGYVELGFDGGYTMIYGSQYDTLYNKFVQQLSEFTYGYNTSTSYLASIGAGAVVDAVIRYLSDFYINNYETECNTLVYEEFNSDADIVTCDPTGLLCTWQWGYVRSVEPSLANRSFSTNMIYSLIDQLSKVDSNPNNIYYDGNVISYYNSFSFCTAYNNQMYYNTSNSQCSATNLSYTVHDAIVDKPAGLWGIEHGDISGLNTTYLDELYEQQSYSTRYSYFNLACNLSTLIHKYYRDNTDFHDYYVVRYLNKNQDKALNHTFSLNSSTVWKEIGWAQWGGGYVTEAIIGVKAVYQVKRDGMWYFGTEDYYTTLIEYSSWAIISGFPNAYINNPYDVEALLTILADDTDDGVAFRQYVAYASTTYIGNGKDYINGVGAIGDYAYTSEANTANFTCTGTSYEQACSVLNTFITSSPHQCDIVQNLYESCLILGFQNNKFTTNCDRFETSLTAPLSGIQCDNSEVLGHNQNYTKSRGNIVNSMMYSTTNELRLLAGLWCEDFAECDYKRGGMFTTTTVKQLLFEGFTDPSVIAYLNLKHSKYLHFQCNNNNSIDYCGVESYYCIEDTSSMSNEIIPSGLQLHIKNASSIDTPDAVVSTIILKYDSSGKSFDQYYVPYFEITSFGEIIWRYSIDTVKANRGQMIYNLYQAIQILKEDKNITTYDLDVFATNYSEYIPFWNFTIVKVLNPLWTAYPAWNVSTLSSASTSSTYSYPSYSTDYNSETNEQLLYQKYIQCKKRVYFGDLDFFSSCVDSLLTGRNSLNETLQLVEYHGNDTIIHFTSANSAKASDTTQMVVNGTSQKFFYTMYLWDGFISYPYEYQGLSSGISRNSLKYPRYFDKLHLLSFELSQLSLQYSYQKDLTLNFPSIDTFRGQNISTGISFPVRRFTETTETWDNLRDLGIPKDSYGMNYTIPYGMASIERLSGIPLYLGTSNCYGNELWGGTEYSQVTGYNPDQPSQQTFMDYDPVTGYGLRNGIRQQLHIRVEANVIFPNVFQSQKRCIPPTKLFSAGTGYGCFTYIPILWFEDATIMSETDFTKFNHQYYSRPERAYQLTLIGIVVGLVTAIMGSCLLIRETYYRRKFNNRVYVD